MPYKCEAIHGLVDCFSNGPQQIGLAKKETVNVSLITGLYYTAPPPPCNSEEKLLKGNLQILRSSTYMNVVQLP